MNNWHRLQQKYAPYFFVAPFLVLFAFFQAWPIAKSLILAFYSTTGPENAIFVGPKNFTFLLRDSDFWVAVKNTVTFALWSLLLQLPIALSLAVLLSQPWIKGRNWLRLAFFSPQLVGSVFVGVLFSALLVPKDGMIINVLNAISPASFPLDTKFLGDQRLVMPTLVLTGVWLYSGYHMIYYLAALQAVDKDLYEAAQMDGAAGWQQFRAVTLPGIKPVVIFTLLTSTIGSFQLFELPYILLNQSSGPNNSGLTVVMYLYRVGFVTGDLGYASTVGWTLAFMVLLVSLTQLRLTGAMKGSEA
ncbi:MAG TPA: sugar ABC transporter permease [Abditibacteriaceae bacterium]|jgi:ABC-type sugar transport system permease subunit